MSDLQQLRARLRDRQQKAGAMGMTDTTICLDLPLIEDLEALKAERADTGGAEGRKRLGAGATDTSDLDGRIAAQEQEVLAASVRVVFRSISSSKYQELLNSYPGASSGDAAEFRAFCDHLAGVCLHEIWEGDERTHVPPDQSRKVWEDVSEGMFFGEWDIVTSRVLALNRRSVDVPFSPKPSATTRPR